MIKYDKPFPIPNYESDHMDKYLDWLNAKADQAVLQFGMTKEEAITVLFKESLAEEHEGAIELMKMGDLEWIISHVTKHRS